MNLHVTPETDFPRAETASQLSTCQDIKCAGKNAQAFTSHRSERQPANDRDALQMAPHVELSLCLQRSLPVLAWALVL